MRTESLSGYAELDCLSNFSFLRGASHPEELVERAAQLGYSALALSDECSFAGVVRAHVAAKKYNIKLIIGTRFRLSHGEIIILARNITGYGDLSELITLARSRHQKGQYTFSLDDILSPATGYGYTPKLPDCLAIYKPDYGLDATQLHQQLEQLSGIFPSRLWLGLSLHYRHADAAHKATLEHAATHYQLPLLATGQAEMHVRSRQALHDTLAAIHLKKPLELCGYLLKPNAERHLRSRLRLMNIYPSYTLREAVLVSELCTFSLDDIRYQYPTEITPPGMSTTAYLRQETWAGAHRRYPLGVSQAISTQLEHELALITELNYESYFLTVYDIVLFARQHNILCQGRGSAANSAVCYCLGITEVDPENGNALFARFISRERNEPPDIDVDFEHQRREEVIQYIYTKYGRDRAALTAVVSSYRTRSVLRDTGKALGLDADLIDKVAKSFLYWDGKQTLIDKMAAQGMDPNGRITKIWAALALDLKGFPRHLSQHPGGFVIARDNLRRLVPIENAAMPDRSIVQWDKDDLDAMKLLKVDVLGLGMLSALQRCLKLVSQRRNQPFSMQQIPTYDRATYQMMQKADTIGVFQIESRAQMSMLPRLKPKEFYDLVVQVAIVRPGPIQGGMVHPYLRRRQKLELVDYPGPEVESVLSRTLGVAIFQEQVMQIAMVAADFTADEADELRRSMAAWRRRGGVEKFHDRLIQGMEKKGYATSFAESIYKQLQGFGEYGFPESHAASFAKIAYQSAWLKCHEPEAFLAALLNSQPMGFYSPSQLVQDAQRHGVQVLPVDIHYSQAQASLEDVISCVRQHPSTEQGLATKARSATEQYPGSEQRPAVRLGLNQIKGLSKQAGLRIINARAQQPYHSTHDLALRAALTRHDLEALAAANALQALSGHRRHALWQTATAISTGLLRSAPITEAYPPTLSEPSEGQNVIADYQATGLSLGRHPLALLRSILQARHFVTADTLSTHYPDRRLARACGIVTTRQRPQTANGTVFVTLEDETGNVNVIVRAELAVKQYTPLTQSRLMGVYGVWQRQSGVCHLKASRLVDLSHLLGELHTRSRDFH
ncbi:MAG: error-prone DNA polymerase [Burkholderiaceae bacterium]|nr:error-prone DNA polymerase [Burkholderiaceae bacterium]